jgi:nucleoporin NUP82
VTKDAGVRLWELDINNRSSFNEPALAVDLKKLSNAATVREDFSASKYGVNKGYSADDVEMQVAGSCFGGSGKEDEDGWSSMTLWIAMTEGDVYALCPFLPAKFWAPSSLLPTLSTNIVAKASALNHDRQGSELDRRIAQQQSAWLADLDEQDPTTIPGDTNNMDVFSRPERPGMIPRLQGPFQVSPEADFGEVTDIHVIAPKLDDEDFFDDEEDFADLGLDDGLSVGIVCLATKTGKVRICLNLEGVEAEWLPSKRLRSHMLDNENDVKELLLFETINLERVAHETSQQWPTFTPSPVDRYELFTTQPCGVYSISLRSWIGDLEAELSAPQVDSTKGIAFRLKLLLESASSVVEDVMEFEDPHYEINAALAILSEYADPGYVILTTASNEPMAAILDLPSGSAHAFAPEALTSNRPIAALESRAPYQPDNILFRQSALPAQLEVWRRESATGSAGDIRGEIRFSPYTLQKVTEAHRILSSETHALGTAVGDLFRRCERMMNEMRAQVEKVRELSNRVNSVTGEDEFPEQRAGEPELVRGGRYKISKRIEERQAKTQEIQERVERLRMRMRGLAGKELSTKEKAFMEEVERLQRSIDPPTKPTTPEGLLRMGDSEPTDSLVLEADQETIVARFTAVQDVYRQLVAQAASVQRELDAAAGAGAERRPGSTAGSQPDFRQRKLEDVWKLLERQTALVDAVSERLEKLRVAAM